MEIQGVPKIGISSVVHSKHIDPDCIDVVDNDIALFDTESVVSLYSGPSKLEVVTVGLCLGGGSKFNISLREYEIVPGRMVIVLPNQIIEHRWFSPDFKAIFFAVSKNLLEALPKVGNVLSLFFYLKDYPCFDLTPHEQDIIREYYSFIRKRLKNKEDLYRREVVMGLMQGFFFELCNIFNSHAPTAAATVKNKSRKEYIFERFYESLIESYQSERSVKFYADQLCLTPKHLSGVVKEVSGKTVGEGIDELEQILRTIIRSRRIFLEKVFPYSQTGRIQTIRRYGQLLEEEYRDDGVAVKAYVPAELFAGLYSDGKG